MRQVPGRPLSRRRAHHPAINQACELVRRCVAACGVTAYDELTGAGELRYLQLTVVGGGSGGSGCNGGGGGAAAGPGSAEAPPSVQVVLVWNAEPGGPASIPMRRLQRLADSIWQQVGEQQRQQRGQQAAPLIHSVWANFQPARTNTILGPDWRRLHGPERTWARLGGADICFAPGSFMQVSWLAGCCGSGLLEEDIKGRSLLLS